MTVWISTNSKSYLWHLDQKENNFKLIKIGNLLELTPLKKLVYEKIVVILGGGAGINSHFQFNSNKLSAE